MYNHWESQTEVQLTIEDYESQETLSTYFKTNDKVPLLL